MHTLGFIPYGELDPSRLPEERDAAKDFLVGQPIRAKIVQVDPYMKDIQHLKPHGPHT